MESKITGVRGVASVVDELSEVLSDGVVALPRPTPKRFLCFPNFSDEAGFSVVVEVVVVVVVVWTGDCSST
jgi:hypothetical protein